MNTIGSLCELKQALIDYYIVNTIDTTIVDIHVNGVSVTDGFIFVYIHFDDSTQNRCRVNDLCFVGLFLHDEYLFQEPYLEFIRYTYQAVIQKEKLPVLSKKIMDQYEQSLVVSKLAGNALINWQYFDL